MLCHWQLYYNMFETQIALNGNKKSILKSIVISLLWINIYF